MLSRGENQLLRPVGLGTPMGTLIRFYWIPATFSNPIAKSDSRLVRAPLRLSRLEV
jgi:hypothetical protein